MYNILCFITPGDTAQTVDLLLRGLTEMAAAYYDVTRPDNERIIVQIPEIPQLELTPREAFYAQTERVRFTEARNRIIAEFIYIYPPGIPVLLPGEVISEANIDYIQAHIAAHLPVKGPEDASIEYVKVIAQ
jgi:arginine decarboxylase